MTTDNTELKKAPVCYPYIAGYLEQSMRHVAQELVDKGLMIESAVWAAQAHIDSVVKRAYEAERKHSVG